MSQEDTVFDVLAVPESFPDGVKYYAFYDQTSDCFMVQTDKSPPFGNSQYLTSFTVPDEASAFTKLDEIEAVYREHWSTHE